MITIKSAFRMEFAMAIILCSCATREVPGASNLRPGTSRELSWLEQRSSAGDKAASIKLALYFDRTKGNRLAAQTYYLRAAQQGDPACMHNYAMGELWYVALPAVEAAEEWAAKAKENGEHYADSPLRLSRKLLEVFRAH
jgi:hypothetical protein